MQGMVVFSRLRVDLVYLVNLVCLVFWLNETNQMNQINQINKTNQINQMIQTNLKRRGRTVSAFCQGCAVYHPTSGSL